MTNKHPLYREAPPPPAPPQFDRPPIAIPPMRPLVTRGLLVVNVTLFVAGFFVPAWGDWLLLRGANNTVQVYQFGEYYRILTSIFLHWTVPHLLFNSYALYVEGAGLERFYGHGRFLLIYLLSGITGSLFSLAFGNESVYGAGASGAIFGLFGAQIALLYRLRHVLGRQRAMYFLRSAVGVVVINFALGLALPNIGNLAHLGGLIGGLILGYLTVPQLTPLPAHEQYIPMAVLRPVQRDTIIYSAFATVVLVSLVLVGVLS
ncbi:MAG: rhomboid family intramembrane serine protease [Phototrophicaceae bacterium]